jgi:hypothetical protein
MNKIKQLQDEAIARLITKIKRLQDEAIAR